MSNVTAVQGVRRTIRERVDGSLTVLIDIAPYDKAAFLKLLPDVDMPVALAPLRMNNPVRESNTSRDAEAAGDGQQTETAGQGRAAASTWPVGPLCQLACMWCKEPRFQQWLFHEYGDPNEVFQDDEEAAAMLLRSVCEIDSRKRLDTDPAAKERYDERIRRPFMEFIA